MLISSYVYNARQRSGRWLQNGLLSLWLLLIMLCYFANNGGHGLSLPYNCIAWGVMGLLILLSSQMLPVNIAVSRPGFNSETLLFVGGLLWSLPLLWTPDATTLQEGWPHVAALWGFMLLLWTLRRLPARLQRLHAWLTIIWLAAVAQGLFAFLQVTLFAAKGSFLGDRPIGIFQQVNLLASFLATGLACALFCFYRQHRTSVIYRSLACFALIFIAFMIPLLQSRTGAIGAGLALLLLTWQALRHGCPIRLIGLALGLMSAGVLLALLWQFGVLNISLAHNTSMSSLPATLDLRDTSNSTNERWHILQNTWQMIREHPLLGTGYGSFESAFAKTALQHGRGVVGLTLIHPHNELMYAWAEGGLFALGGLLLMVSGVLLGVGQRGGLGWRGVAMLLPIAVHMNLEYPLYQSAPHGVVLILLLSLILPRPGSNGHGAGTKKNSLLPAIRLVLPGLGLIMVVYMAGAFQTQQVLTRIERQDMAPLVNDESATLQSLWNPYAFVGRIDYDRHIALLMRYNQRPDPQSLIGFSLWAKRYLIHHNDRNVMVSLLQIANVISPQDVPDLCRQARALWPNYPGFTCSFLNYEKK